MNHRRSSLVRSGKSSLAVVIPHDWLVENGLKYGDAVDIFYDGDDVYIRKPVQK